MKLNRREFVAMVGASLTPLPVSSYGAQEGPEKPDYVLEVNNCQLKVSSTGAIVSLRDGYAEMINSKLGMNNPRVLILGRKLYVCDQPVSSRRDGSRVLFRYAFTGRFDFSVEYGIGLDSPGREFTVLTQNLAIVFPTKIDENVQLVLPRNIQLPVDRRKVFLPLKNGIGRRKPIAGLDNDDEYIFRFAGSYKPCAGQMLAIPMLDEYAENDSLHLTLCSDPLFTSYFTLPYGDRAGEFHCVYLHEAGLQGREDRSLYTILHRGDSNTAMKAFYSTALAEVKPGPDWVHDVAMVDFDYLSKNGQGWFADINKLKEVIRPEDRSKVFLALHGWYDLIGRYCFNHRSQSFEKEWTAFPNARAPEVQAFHEGPETCDTCSWSRPSVKEMQPVQMSLSEMHRRIRYAKEHGFKVGLYFSDGINCCTGAVDVYDPTKVLSWGGWWGPDTIGKVCGQNPLHPEVRSFFMDYMRAALEEYGGEVDGFVWDETCTIMPGNLGSDAYPGYADRAMMTLIKDVAALVGSFSPHLALFASDLIGLYGETGRAPNAIFAHGTYQDSACRPEAWPYGLFPNFRNALWSCNWAPVTNFRFTKYAMETFNIPVAISKGAFGDDIGISDMNPRQVKDILDLFQARKSKRTQLTWIEEGRDGLTYKGKKMAYQWVL
jgi:hypothetical protein